jgi:glycosyltransferase involved in cell wall biosynthesis
LKASRFLKRVPVVQMTDVTGRGGAERALVDLALRLERGRFDVSVVATRHAGNYQPLLDEAGVRTTILERNSRRDMHKLLGLVGHLRRERVGVLHTHLFGSNTWGRLLGRLAGVPVVITHEHWSSKDEREVWVDRLLYRLSDLILVPSEASKRTVIEREGIPAGRIKVAYNGVDPAVFKPTHDREETRRELSVSSGDLLVGTVGRLSPEKGGVDHLIRAVAEAREAHPSLKLLVVGDGPLRPMLEEVAREAALPVIFTGTRQDVPRLLGALDLFVLPSLLEAMPIALLEAMATRLPTVATRVGGVPEIVRDGEDGLLVPPGDRTALAAAIDRLAGDPALRCRLAEAGQRRVLERFTIGGMVRRVENIYERLLARKGIVLEERGLQGALAARGVGNSH